ncbi:MAG TPA: DUF5114 domain-containing protein [Porphyromonadaceae bacterium]|nr:DUF5114 domain-containing protein [Porphyromonadaceae bacterium]
MKMKQSIYILLVSIFVVISSCEKDGDFLTTTGGGVVTLQGSTEDIVLNYDAADDLALTIYWTDNGEISLSNPGVLAPENAIANTIQLAANADFSNAVEQRAEDGIFQHQYTHYELNAQLSRLGMEGGVSYPLYIRIRSEIGNNMPPAYSNVITMSVTPYLIDMSVGYILDSAMGETGRTLYSATSNGIYEGFLGVTAWYNWYLREGEGSVWGNDGVDGTAFIASKETSHWNFWFPGQAGSYYTILNTTAREWSALHIPTLTVAGDVNGEMTFDRTANRWSYAFNNTATGTINVTISGTGKQYNLTTGTDDAAATDTPIGFSGTPEKLTFGNNATPITVPVSGTGSVTLILDLSNPQQWLLTVTEGSSTPIEIPPLLYLSGVDDGTSGSWTFDNYLRLFNEDALGYGGGCNVNSLWGYKFYNEKDNWSDAYGMAEGGTALAGSLLFGGGVNITAPQAGLYLIEMYKKALTYKLTPISSVSYSGLDDDWTLHTMTPTETVGVYSAQVTIAGPSPWGFQIILNENWDLKFGGSNGELILYGGNLTNDASLSAGTYTLTVDVCKQIITLK